MAKGYQLIQTQTLTGSASSVTFSNLPQNFTDLLLKISVRSSQSGAYADYGTINFNGSTSNFSYKDVYGNGSTASTTGGSTSLIMVYQGNAGTANVFGNIDFYIPNYTSSNYKSFSIDSVVENNATTGYTTITAGLWSSTAAITSITLSPASGTWSTNSSFMLYGIGGTRATGGTITADGNYTYHTFTSTTLFTALEKINNAEFLVVAGGGGGGSDRAGGGGAGGYRSSTGQTFLAGTSYTALVGAGGAGGAGGGANNGVKGGTSSFRNISSTGGGGGGAGTTGLIGGSGGGGFGQSNYAGGAGNEGGYSPVEGYAGGASYQSGAIFSSGGGGGAGGVGLAATSAGPGHGGPGSNAHTTWLTATGTGNNGYLAGGGGGLLLAQGGVDVAAARRRSGLRAVLGRVGAKSAGLVAVGAAGDADGALAPRVRRANGGRGFRRAESGLRVGHRPALGRPRSAACGCDLPSPLESRAARR
jgi:hypothetical protein